MSGEVALRCEHEMALAFFVERSRRVRFREALKDPQRRASIENELYRFQGRGLDPRWAALHEMHTKHGEHVVQVYETLVAYGAPSKCFVVADIDLDGQEVLLRKAVERLMWAGEGFLSCLHGRLGLYVSEDGSDVYILRRDVT